MRRKARVDRNHADIRARYRAYGWFVIDTSSVGSGFPDLIALKAGRVEFIEVKDGDLPPSRQRLTEAEKAIHEVFKAKGLPIRIVTSVDEVST
jgi:Holliday junction resolvase